jgi:phosphoenolpyruvate---glycerone phosphotransferase subunit DhaL
VVFPWIDVGDDGEAPAAAKAAEVADQPLPEAMAAVATAALDGLEASKALIAQFGRAKTMGEACIGFPDAGAMSVTVILSAFNDFIQA